MSEPKTNAAGAGLSDKRAAEMANAIQQFIYNSLISTSGISRISAMGASVNAANKALQSLRQDLGEAN